MREDGGRIGVVGKFSWGLLGSGESEDSE